MNEDGLLDPVDESEDAWLVRPTPSDADPLRTAVEFVGDLVATRHIVWPAARDGMLVPPPPEHVLDALVRWSLLEGESNEWDAAWLLRPTAMTVVFKRDLTDRCDICRQKPARYDGYLKEFRRPGWMCPWCYLQHSTLRLGPAEGQFVMRYCEITNDLWERYRVARAIWQERGAPVSAFDLAEYRDPNPKPLGPPFPGAQTG